MTWALVLGGAQNVYEDLNEAMKQFGNPDIVIGVKDIAIEYPRIDYWITYHCDRIPREIAKRRSLGYPDPKAIYTYSGIRFPAGPTEIRRVKVRGGSSGLLGAIVGTMTADRAVLAGIPMDVDMPHYHNRKHGKPWKEGRMYKKHWEDSYPQLKDKVKSMSGWTALLLGKPTKEWVHGIQTSGEDVHLHSKGEGAASPNTLHSSSSPAPTS